MGKKAHIVQVRLTFLYFIKHVLSYTELKVIIPIIDLWTHL